MLQHTLHTHMVNNRGISVIYTYNFEWKRCNTRNFFNYYKCFLTMNRLHNVKDADKNLLFTLIKWNEMKFIVVLQRNCGEVLTADAWISHLVCTGLSAGALMLSGGLIPRGQTKWQPCQLRQYDVKWSAKHQIFILFEQLYYLLLIIHSLNMLIYLNTFS